MIIIIIKKGAGAAAECSNKCCSFRVCVQSMLSILGCHKGNCDTHAQMRITHDQEPAQIRQVLAPDLRGTGTRNRNHTRAQIISSATSAGYYLQKSCSTRGVTYQKTLYFGVVVSLPCKYVQMGQSVPLQGEEDAPAF